LKAKIAGANGGIFVQEVIVVAIHTGQRFWTIHNSISYGIVKRHGGALTVESRLGQGSVFRLTLPL
jgi:hypothetical protein